MTPPPFLQLERNQLGVSSESTDGKMTPTRGELMETTEINDGFVEAPPFNGELDTVEGHLQQTTESSVEENLQQTTESSANERLQQLQEVLRDDICSQLQIVLKLRPLLYWSNAHRPGQWYTQIPSPLINLLLSKIIIDIFP